MVSALLSSLDVLLAQAEANPKLPEPIRAYALMALLGIALLGMFLVVIILLGGHWVRKIGNYRRGPSVPPDFVLRPVEDPEAPVTDAQGPATGETTITQDTKNA